MVGWCFVSAAFEWDEVKDIVNQQKHGVSFFEAQQAFFDRNRIILDDAKHSQDEKRYFCLGWVNGSILTVRFTYRGDVIRILGAGYWRKGEKTYVLERSHKETYGIH